MHIPAVEEGFIRHGLQLAYKIRVSLLAAQHLNHLHNARIAPDLLQKVDKESLDLLQIAALPFVHRRMLVHVLDDLVLGRAKDVGHVLEMQVEGRAVDVRSRADILDRDRDQRLLQNQVNQGFTQRRPCKAYSAVVFRLRHEPFLPFSLRTVHFWYRFIVSASCPQVNTVSKIKCNQSVKKPAEKPAGFLRLQAKAPHLCRRYGAGRNVPASFGHTPTGLQPTYPPAQNPAWISEYPAGGSVPRWNRLRAA